MMDAFDLASKLFGNSRAESRGDVSNSLDMLAATGAGDSSAGAATVYLDADVTPADDYDGDDYAIGIPTSPNVIEGDGVLVGLTGSGPLKTPVVISNPGSGDRMQTQVDDAETLAQQAEAVAQEASAEVEQVRQDVADFRDDVATTYATKVERQDGDDAVKTWVTTNYTNSNDLATTYATKTLVSQTKDAIELAASQTYETQTDAAATYATKAALTVGLNGIRSEVAEDYQPKGDYATTASMNSAIQQSASSIESSVAATYETKTDASTTYATKTEVNQTASALDTRITTATNTANTANGNATAALDTANDALADSVEYIIGTQTAATNAWTGETRDAALVAGKTIAYKLPYAGNSSAATLNLTLSGGGTTGAKGVRRMTDNNVNYIVTTQYGAGAVLQMTYDGEYWRVSSGYNPTNDINNARYRTQIPSAVKAAAAYTAGHIICGTSAGYKNIGAGVAFDLGYPLLYATASVAAGATGTGNYLEFENRTAPANGTVQSGAADKTLYLKGTVSGNTFTIAASPFMTTVVPSSEDGCCYIPLGLMYSATKIYFQSSDQLYAYTEGAFQPIGRGALATAQAEATERQTLIRQFSGGVLAGYVGNAIAALVNAAGSFDVVRTAWSGGVPSILGTLARYAASGISLFDAAGNVLAEFASDHVRIGGDVPDGTGVESVVQFFDQTETHDTDLTASTYFDGDGSTYQTMQSTVNLSSTLADEGKAIDTGSSGTAALDLVNVLENGISDVGEQHNEVHAALVADASYSDGATTSHAAVRATASTTGGSGLSYAELIADALGIGTNEGSIDYVAMRQVLCALLHPSATYTAGVGTWTNGHPNAWEIAGYSVTVTETGHFTDYLDASGKGVGEFVALVGCTVRVAACVTWVDSIAGRRSVGAFVNATRSGTTLTGGTEYSNSGLFYTGSNAKTAQLSPLILHLAAGNRLNFGKYAPASAVQSNQTYKMNWVTLEVLSVD